MSMSMALGATVLMVRALLALPPTPAASDAVATQGDDPAVLAAIVYTGNRSEEDEDSYDSDEPYEECDPEADALDECKVEVLIRHAVDRGSSLVVLSEAAFEEADPESLPVVGRRPPRTGAPLQRRFAALARELEIYLVIQLELTDGALLRSAQIAFDPDGVVVARHYKFELYDSEVEEYAPGDDVSVFSTPFGKVGLLVCSDLYGDPRMHERLVDTLGAQIIALSSIWTVEDSTRWQAAFAHDWGVVLVAANGAAGYGRGAGIYDRTGRAVVVTHDGRDEVVTGAVQ